MTETVSDLAVYFTLSHESNCSVLVLEVERSLETHNRHLEMAFGKKEA